MAMPRVWSGLIGESSSELIVARPDGKCLGDIATFTADFRDATVVTLYLLPSLNVKLRPKLWKELRRGARVVSHDFDMGDWKPLQTHQLGNRTVYFWTIQ